MQDISRLVDRLEKLERQNRRMKRIGFAAIAVIGVGLLIGADGDKPEVLDEIRVKKLVVEDDAGIVRCQVEANTTMALFQLFDLRGKRRVRLAVDEKRRTADFTLFQKDGRMRLGSGCIDGGAAWVNLLHPRGRAGRVARGMASQ